MARSRSHQIRSRWVWGAVFCRPSGVGGIGRHRPGYVSIQKGKGEGGKFEGGKGMLVDVGEEEEGEGRITSYHLGPSAQILMSFALKSRVSWSMFLRSNFEASMVTSDFNDMIGSIKQHENAWNRYLCTTGYTLLIRLLSFGRSLSYQRWGSGVW